jgi:hypothetical protein
MKPELRIFLCSLVFQASLSLCLAHDNETMHPKITDSAAQSSIGLQNFLSGNYVNSSEGITNWLISGSVFEDIPFTRGFNHFYDPVHYNANHQHIGLTDGFDWWAYPSFRWVTEDLTQFGNQSFPWSLVRAYELSALTNSSQAVRQQKLEWTMFYLGHVIHLNQDLTVPAHVRNDNHGLTTQNGPFETLIMWTENYGRKTYSTQEVTKAFPLQKQHQGWSWWQNTAGFQKLEDFWNRDFLTVPDPSAALNADASTNNPTPLGLSEFCNGNFISEDATYGDFFTDHSAKHWFQYPQLADTTQPNLMRLRWGAAETEVKINTITLPNGKSGKHPYLSKTKSGIKVNYHSALNYEAVRNPGKLNTYQMHVMLTLNDPNVQQEYHEKLIPKAIEYSTGILDYFFRGTMDFWVTGDDTESTITLRNTSSQDFHDGAFFVFIETNGVRALVQTNLLEGLLPAGGNTIFTCNQAATNQYFVFYQGTIGWSNNAALDPVDAGIAIAPGCPNHQFWHSSFEGGENSEPTNGDYFAEGWHVDSGSVDHAVNGIWGQQAYEGDFLLDLDGNDPGTISTNILTVAGQRYQLSFMYSHNPGDPPTNITAVARIMIDSNVLDTLAVGFENTWTNLDWHRATYEFTAGSAFTHLSFQSLDTGKPWPLDAYGVLLDAITLKPVN